MSSFDIKTQKIAFALSRIVESRGWSQTELAIAIKKDTSYTSKLLAGRIPMTLRTLCDVEDALGAIIMDIPTAQGKAWKRLAELEAERQKILAGLSMKGKSNAN